MTQLEYEMEFNRLTGAIKYEEACMAKDEDMRRSWYIARINNYENELYELQERYFKQ